MQFFPRFSENLSRGTLLNSFTFLVSLVDLVSMVCLVYLVCPNNYPSDRRDSLRSIVARDVVEFYHFSLPFGSLVMYHTGSNEPYFSAFNLMPRGRQWKVWLFGNAEGDVGANAT
jgi:hypothetical protein